MLRLGELSAHQEPPHLTFDIIDYGFSIFSSVVERRCAEGGWPDSNWDVGLPSGAITVTQLALMQYLIGVCCHPEFCLEDRGLASLLQELVGY